MEEFAFLMTRYSEINKVSSFLVVKWDKWGAVSASKSCQDEWFCLGEAYSCAKSLLHLSQSLIFNLYTKFYQAFLILTTTMDFFLQEQAFELSQKYKEGKYIIELSHMIKDNGWDWDWTLHCSPWLFISQKVASPPLKRVTV